MPSSRSLNDPIHAPPLPEGAYENSVRLSVGDIVGSLVEVLGSSLVMQLAGVSDSHAVSEWKAGSRNPRAGTEQRLRTAYRVFQMILGADNEYAARAWMIGLNPQLGDEAPVDAIREGHLKDVVAAAAAFTQTS